MTSQPPEVTVTTSHDLSDWRTAHEDNVPGPELDRIRARVAAASNRGENDAVVAVVLDEASAWRTKAAAVTAHRDNLAAMIQRLSEFLDSKSLNSWKHGACWAAEDAIKTLLAERDDLMAQTGCTDPDRREGHCCGADES